LIFGLDLMTRKTPSTAVIIHSRPPLPVTTGLVTSPGSFGNVSNRVQEFRAVEFDPEQAFDQRVVAFVGSWRRHQSGTPLERTYDETIARCISKAASVAQQQERHLAAATASSGSGACHQARDTAFPRAGFSALASRTGTSSRSARPGKKSSMRQQPAFDFDMATGSSLPSP
jgi:hypothetical protein